METSLIEQLDKTRYNLMKWITIGWATWYATIIGNEVIHGHLFVQITFWLGLFGVSVFLINLVKYLKLKNELKRNPKLRDALEDELHHFNIGKSYKFSFWTMIGVAAVIIIISNLVSLTAILTAQLISYFGVLSFFCSSLYYNRD